MLTETTAERYVIGKMEEMGYEFEIMFSELLDEGSAGVLCDVHIRYRDEGKDILTATWCVWEQSDGLYGEW